MENFLDIHVKAFENIGGIHKEIVYDNMKQAVKTFVGLSGNEKGHVERGIEFIRRKVFSRKQAFGSIEEANKYSVPDYLVGKFVIAKIYPATIKIYYKDSLVASHERSYLVHKWIIDINHFIHTLKKKPGALHSSAGRHQMCPELQTIYHNYYINNPKDFIVLLELIKKRS